MFLEGNADVSLFKAVKGRKKIGREKFLFMCTIFSKGGDRAGRLKRINSGISSGI